MFISIVVCTRNRAGSLNRTIRSITEVEPHVSNPRWELLILDNGSSDGTRDVAMKFSDRLPIKYIFESRPGLAIARNTALHHASGDYIVWIDDDVVVHRSWWIAYVDAFSRWPETALFGGRIRPVLADPSPTWFREAAHLLQLPMAVRDIGEKSFILPAHTDFVPYGANCAVKADVQRRFPFDPQRGAGASYTGEEITSFFAMLSAGVEGRWLPDAAVDHHIATSRQTTAYIHKWFKTMGRTLVWTEQDRVSGVRVFGIPLWLLRRAISREILYWFTRSSRPAPIWVKHLIWRALDRGRIVETLVSRDRWSLN